MKRIWAVLTVKEPLPVLTHATLSLPRCGEGDGPFYNAGSEWFYPSESYDHVERSAAYLRGLGYTVTVTRRAS